jgi:hypothetical protein
MEEWLDLNEVLERAHDLVDMGLFDEARELLEPYAEVYRDVWEIPFVYSRICGETGRHRDAVKYLQRCLKLGGHNVDTYLGLFYAYAQSPHAAPYERECAQRPGVVLRRDEPFQARADRLPSGHGTGC